MLFNRCHYCTINAALFLTHQMSFSCIQGSCGSFKSLSFFFQIFKAWKVLENSMVLESPWICVWRSLKVLELDFLKCSDWTSDCYHQMRFLGSKPQKCVSGDLLAGFEVAASPAYAYTSAGLLSFRSPYLAFVWSLKVLGKSLDLILSNGQEPCV